jgi:hypothetical protein
MAAAKKATKKTARGRSQDRAKVAGGQIYEVSYEAKKTGRSASAVKNRQRPRQGRKEASTQEVGLAPAGQSGGHSGQVSPIDARTSLTSATAASGESPAGGC